MNMSQQLEQSLKLDEEYNLLFAKILNELGHLSSISQEFVNFKLKFLESSTLQLQKIQIDERLLRNQQLENLYQYVKMNQKQKISPESETLMQRNFSLHQLHKPTPDELSQRNLDTQRYQVLNYYYNPANRASVQTARKSIVSQHQTNQSTQYNTTKEQEALLKKAMTLLEKNKYLFPKQYENLATEYESYIKSNLDIIKKQQLKQESNKIKNELDQLLSTSRKFKQFLGKVK